MSEDPWSWKDKDRSRKAGLLYEPGNWGDVLKGTWAWLLAQQLGGRPWTYLDPFAGAPDYPLTQPVSQRLALLRDSPFVAAQKPFVEQGRLASTAALLSALPGCRPSLYDIERAQLWPRPLPLSTAEEALPLALQCETAFDLVLWDPYDFFERWSDWVGPLLQVAARSPVLIYLYNKAPRGPSQTRQYHSLRARLKVRHAAGRIPSDILLPRAFHEMLLLDAQGRFDLDEVHRETLRLAQFMAEGGAWEVSSERKARPAAPP